MHVFLCHLKSEKKHKNMRRVFFIGITILGCSFLINCKQNANESKSDVSQLLDEVMRYHDEAMAKLPALKKLGTKLYDVQQLGIYQSWPDERKQELGQILNQLGDAEKTMWNWMYAYVQPEETQPDEQKIEYLNSELEKVKIVHKKIFDGMDLAQKFSDKHKIQYVQ
jgi:hypothetical protein